MSDKQHAWGHSGAHNHIYESTQNDLSTFSGDKGALNDDATVCLGRKAEMNKNQVDAFFQVHPEWKHGFDTVSIAAHFDASWIAAGICHMDEDVAHSSSHHGVGTGHVRSVVPPVATSQLTVASSASLAVTHAFRRRRP